MAKNKFTFTYGDGRVAKRSSERTYTHVVLKSWNLVAMRAEAVDSKWDKTDRSNYEFYASQPKYAHVVAAHPTVESYLAECKASRVAFVNKQFGEGEISAEFVVQWSMSEANARKAARADGHTATIRVAPVDQNAEAVKYDDGKGAEGWEPVADPDAWKARDAALIAARRAR
jgi:hypothetical protein